MFRWVLIFVAALARMLRSLSPMQMRYFNELAERQQDDLLESTPDTRNQMDQYTR